MCHRCLFCRIHFHKEIPAKPLLKQKFNPAVVWDNTTHQNAVGVNTLYFNNFLLHPIGRLVDW
ncbi:MAG: hypothetical protein IK065_00045 [Neisseriaceae bacterium]|nr:hypothetical protein [Neisseriaceae bacterium]